MVPDDLPEIEIGCEFRTRRLSEQPEGGAADARKEEGRGNEAVVGALLEPLGRRSRKEAYPWWRARLGYYELSCPSLVFSLLTLA